MNKNLPFCCYGIRLLRGDYFEIDGECGPLEFLKSEGTFKVVYYFASKGVWFCPICGTTLYPKEVPSQQPKNKDFCCSTIEHFANLADERDEFEIFYQPFSRRYFFSTATDSRDDNDKNKIYPEWDFYSCLYCGKKLPESLLEKWLEIVKNEFGIERIEKLENMLPFVAQEFRTDAWWKNRGL